MDNFNLSDNPFNSILENFRMNIKIIIIVEIIMTRAGNLYRSVNFIYIHYGASIVFHTIGSGS